MCVCLFSVFLFGSMVDGMTTTRDAIENETLHSGCSLESRNELFFWLPGEM